MRSATFRLVLLVSCGHALVHILEHSFASVEQLVAEEFQVGKDVTGLISSCFRLPFGLFALAAGWMADWLGGRRLLLTYVLGCGLASVLAWLSPGLAGMFLAMFFLGLFAGIYHPAGVGWIAHHTQPDNRPLALGYHGILGSVGIAAGPFLAAFFLQWGITWRQYYLILGVLGAALAGLYYLGLPREKLRAGNSEHPSSHSPSNSSSSARGVWEGSDSWKHFWILSVMTSMAGIVNAAVLTFLPRYLNETGVHWGGVSPASMRNYQAGLVLVLGIVGQYTAGRIARTATLEPLIALCFGLATPCVVWMGFAQGTSRLVAAGLFAVLFFAHQPLYNSAIAKYVVGPRRGLAYGVSFTLGFGVGSLGPVLAGQIPQDKVLYSTLGMILAGAALLAALLWWMHGSLPGPGTDELSPADEEAFL